MPHCIVLVDHALRVGENGGEEAPYDLAAEVDRLRDLDRAAYVIGEILGDVGVKREEIRRAGGILISGILLAYLPKFDLPKRREVI